MKRKYTLYKRKGSKIWYVYTWEGEKRISQSTGKTRRWEAEEYAQSLLGKGTQEHLPLKEFCRDFFLWDRCQWTKRQLAKGRRFSQFQAKNRRRHLDKHILPRWGAVPLGEINRVNVENWLVSLSLSNQTKNHILYTFRIIMREAEQSGSISASPLEKVEAFGNKHKSRDVFTLPELHKLFPKDREKLNKIWGDPKLATAFIILASTGLRSGELRALQWLHWIHRKALYVEQSAKDNETIGPTKTAEVRVVLLPRKAREALETWENICPWTEPQDLIFAGQVRGKVSNRAWLSRALPGAIEEAKINVGGRWLVVHSFRHTYNTLARKLLPEEILRAMTGHKTPGMTDLYDHPGVEERLARLEPSWPQVEAILPEPKKQSKTSASEV